MAAGAARFAHCQVRLPVAYRAKFPFRPEIVAPLDMSSRVGEVYSLDQELDRAVLRSRDRVTLLDEELAEFSGPGGAFVRAPELEEGTLGPHRSEVEPGAARRQFAANRLRLTADSARFRPPWNATLLQEVHGRLLQGIDSDGSATEFRLAPSVVRDVAGTHVFTGCPPNRIADELDAVLDWLDRYGASYHPVVPATVLFEALFAIRPFPVGNVTMARSLALLYLRSSGLRNVDIPPVVPALTRSAEDLGRLLLWTEASGSYTELIDFALDAILDAYAEANLRWLAAPALSPPLEEVDLRLLARARREAGWFSARDAMRWVGARSDQTVLRHLNALVGRRILVTLGNTRAKRYRVAASPSGRPEPEASPPLPPAPGAPRAR